MGNHEKAYQFSHYTERFRNMPVSDWAEPIRSDNGPAPNNWWVGGAVRGLFCYACWSFHTRMLFQAVNQYILNQQHTHPFKQVVLLQPGPRSLRRHLHGGLRLCAYVILSCFLG